MTKLLFTTDKQYDARMIHAMFNMANVSDSRNQAESLGINQDVTKRIIGKSWSASKSVCNKIVDQRYRAIGDKITKTRLLYQKSWNEINDPFFLRVEKLSGYAWEYPVYKCVVSAFHRGISNWNGNVISRIWSENPYTMRKITAHELIVAHVFSIFRNEKRFCGQLADKEIWMLAEISGWCVTGLDAAMLKLWPWISEQQRFPIKHNYPNLVPLQQKMGRFYRNTNSFDKFIQFGINSINRNKA